jgi:hypothetical protein
MNSELTVCTIPHPLKIRKWMNHLFLKWRRRGRGKIEEGKFLR